MTSPQEDSNKGKLCLPLKMEEGWSRRRKGEEEMEGRGCRVNQRART
jgi:hypothetical protein